MKANKVIMDSHFLLMIVRKNSSFQGGQGDVFNHNLKQSFIFFIVLCFSLFTSAIAQEDKEKQKILRQSEELLSKANSEMLKGNFPIAEAEYREAIALNPKEDIGKYNLGNAYYNKDMNASAMQRFKQAAAVADTKNDKHRAFHNLGNTFMNEKKYQEAVEAYKNALRNNPKDEETRYNFALAKELLEEQQKNGGGDDDKDKEDKQDKKDNKDENQKDNKDKNKEGEDGEDGDKKDKDKDKEKKEDKEKDKDKDKKEGDKDKDKGKPEEPKDDKQAPNKPKEAAGKLSPQQVKNLLEAMNNEEKKVQDKINAKKQRGAKVKPTKDW